MCAERYCWAKDHNAIKILIDVAKVPPTAILVSFLGKKKKKPIQPSIYYTQLFCERVHPLTRFTHNFLTPGCTVDFLSPLGWLFPSPTFSTWWNAAGTPTSTLDNGTGVFVTLTTHLSCVPATPFPRRNPQERLTQVAYKGMSEGTQGGMAREWGHRDHHETCYLGTGQVKGVDSPWCYRSRKSELHSGT